MASKHAAAHQAGMYDGYKAGKAAVWKRKGVKIPKSKLPKATSAPKRTTKQSKTRKGSGKATRKA